MSVNGDLAAAFQAALRAVEGSRVVEAELQRRPMRASAVSVAALGKASAAMMQGALRQLGTRVSRGLVVAPQGYAEALTDDARLTVLESAHPVPDERSLRAGERLVEFVECTPRDETLLVLLSGGTSSLVELPVPGITLDRLARLNQELLAEGHDIVTINAVRKALSRIKGGRLGHWLAGRRALVMAISDVRHDAPHVIGSGLLAPDPQPAGLPSGLAALVRDLVGTGNPAPRPDDPALAGVETRIVADNRRAREAAAECLRGRGYRVRLPDVFLGGDVRAVAADLAQQLAGVALAGEVAVWGGEPTVELPAEPGRGGRMHMLAALVADALAGRPGWTLFAGGTDGADGNAGHAGAVVDGGTAGCLPPGALRGCIERADTADCLERAGAVVDTGPTGTNVMDIVIGHVRPEAP